MAVVKLTALLNPADHLALESQHAAAPDPDSLELLWQRCQLRVVSSRSERRCSAGGSVSGRLSCLMCLVRVRTVLEKAPVLALE